MDNIDRLLKSIYYKTSSPGSFGGKERLFLEARKFDQSIKRKDVNDWLSSQTVYTLHKKARRKFKRNPVIAEYPLENFQADLVDLKEFSKQNNNLNYILTIIDVFSKKAWAVPLKYKTKSEVAKAMESVIREHTPKELMTDEGTEFKNEVFKNLMGKYKINHFFAKNKDIKCSVVERFNRTLKEKMFPYFTFIGKRRFIDELQSILTSYNNSYHRSIKMAPSEVNLENSKIVFKNMYKFEDKRDYLRKFKKPKLNVDDVVRRKYDLKKHDRGYYPNWTDETFKVYNKHVGNIKPYYIIKDSTGNIIDKRFYPEEIQKINDQPYRIEKILKHRKKKGVEEVFVKWLNYPESANSWIPANKITGING